MYRSATHGISFPHPPCRMTGSFCPMPWGVRRGINLRRPKAGCPRAMPGAAGTDLPAGYNGSARSWSRRTTVIPIFLTKLEAPPGLCRALLTANHCPYVDIHQFRSGDWNRGHTHFSTRRETPTRRVIEKHIDLTASYRRRGGRGLFCPPQAVRAVARGGNRHRSDPELCRRKGVAFRGNSFWWITTCRSQPGGGR